MVNIDRYKSISEGLTNQTLRDIIETYHDCFIDLLDMGVFIGVSDTMNLNYIEDVLSGKSSLSKYNYFDKPIDINDFTLNIEIFGTSTKNKATSDVLKNIYDYLKQNLLNDEMRFEDATGLKIENKKIVVSILECGVTKGDKRYNEIVRYNELNGRTHIEPSIHRGINCISYDIYPNKGDLYDNPSNNIKIRRKISKFMDWMNKKSLYNFPEITDNMEIKQIEISHHITDKQNFKK